MSNTGPNKGISKSLDTIQSPIASYVPSQPMAIERKSSIPTPYKPYTSDRKLGSSMPVKKTQVDSSDSSDEVDDEKNTEIFEFTYMPAPCLPPKPNKETKQTVAEEVAEAVLADNDSLEGDEQDDVVKKSGALSDEDLFELEDGASVPLSVLNAFEQFSLGPKTEKQQAEDEIAMLGTRPGNTKKFHPKGY